jgi:hypothetical protein
LIHFLGGIFFLSIRFAADGVVAAAPAGFRFVVVGVVVLVVPDKDDSFFVTPPPFEGVFVVVAVPPFATPAAAADIRIGPGERLLLVADHR